MAHPKAISEAQTTTLSMTNVDESTAISAIITAAAAKLDGMIAKGDIKYDGYVMSMGSSKPIKVFEAQTSRSNSCSGKHPQPLLRTNTVLSLQ